MINKIKKIIKENREFQYSQLKYLKELEWAQIYHDSIRGQEGIKDLSLNIGRWAGNYTFFYILNRVLKDYKPLNVLELGLGESSKFISTYLDFYLTNSNHLIIEQDKSWSSAFKLQFSLSKRSKIEICPIVEKNINEFPVKVYENLESKIQNNYDLYVVDGPHGSPRFSRYDIVSIAKKMSPNHEFIIILDDYQRQGEKDTFYKLQSVFKEKGIIIYHETFFGFKEVKIITTEKYKYCCSI
ncbi:hypothetical protein [Lacinutrix sp. MedPE-SW]|uniref:hypothetical protein n=1 Tax=Lacinutrix sp. MedPE-SW TaxID=1860087 RepID=UPI00091BE88D|nr:hypothetical protein [Lacinutrix sp. MedPE-SW]OIQ22727.1 MAG: hypothetical protein BM549_06510 [Lacinutrix sp. MedPE-SW]